MDAEPLLTDLDLSRLSGTFLGDLGEDARGAVLRDATILEVARGQAIFPEGPTQARLGVVLDGTARTFLPAADRRQLTIRYVRAGGMVSSVSGLGGDQVTIGIEAVTDCVVVEFRVETIVRLVRSDIRIAIGILTEIGRHMEQAYATLAANAFASTRERVAAHLLEMATETPGIGLMAAVTQQQLADAVGTVREVTARVLREFRHEGSVATNTGGILLRDPNRLVAIAGRWRTPTRLYRVDPPLGSDADLDATPDAVVAVDADGTIIYANPGVKGTFGWLPRDLIGGSIDRLVPPDVAPRHVAHLARFFAKPTARPMGTGRDLRGRRADGSEFPVEISLAPAETPGGLAVFATIVDISYRTKLKEAVRGARSRPGQPVEGARPGGAPPLRTPRST